MKICRASVLTDKELFIPCEQFYRLQRKEGEKKKKRIVITARPDIVYNAVSVR